jgi:hypothetical protein
MADGTSANPGDDGGMGLELLLFLRKTWGLCRCSIFKWMEFFLVGDPVNGGVDVDR